MSEIPKYNQLKDNPIVKDYERVIVDPAKSDLVLEIVKVNAYGEEFVTEHSVPLCPPCGFSSLGMSEARLAEQQSLKPAQENALQSSRIKPNAAPRENIAWPSS